MRLLAFVAGGAAVRVTFTNELDTASTLYRDGHRLHKFLAGSQTTVAFESGDGAKWTALDPHGAEVFHYVVRAQDGAEQAVAVRRGVERRTIRSIVESDDHARHRVDGAGRVDVGCADPVRAGDVVRVVAVGDDARPALGRDADGRVVAAYGYAAAPEEAWVLDADKAGALYPGNAVYLRHRASGRYADAPPPVDGKQAPLLARWADRGDWQKYTLFKGPSADHEPLSALCYGDDAFLLAHTRNFVDVHDGKAMARWRHRGDWQRLGFERFADAPLEAPDL